MLKNSFTKVLSIFIISRFIVYFFGSMSGYVFTKKESLANAFCTWDCDWYLGLIKNGYQLVPSAHPDGNAANWAFFPVFPKTISTIGNFFHTDYLDLAYLLNNFAFLIALYVLYQYVKKELDEDIALTTVLLISFSPYSLYFSVPYTESFFFLCMILVFYFAHNSQWLYAGIAAAVLSGTRGVGVMIVFSLLIMMVKQKGLLNILKFKNEESYKKLLSLLMAPLGLFFYMHYLYLKTGDALAFSHIQIAWERSPHNPISVLFDGLFKYGSVEFYYALVATIGIILSLVLLWKKRYAEFVISIIAILIPLSTALYSMPRYTFALFPIYIALAILINKTNLVKIFVLIFFSASLAFMSAAWVTTKSFTV